jgi:hypothetical protein
MGCLSGGEVLKPAKEIAASSAKGGLLAMTEKKKQRGERG